MNYIGNQVVGVLINVERMMQLENHCNEIMALGSERQWLLKPLSERVEGSGRYRRNPWIILNTTGREVSRHGAPAL